MISRGDLEKIDIRCGTIIKASVFPKAKKPAYKLKIDFGAAGIKNSSAQITALYQPAELIGRQVTAVINFPPKQIADFMSECPVLGVYNEENNAVLLHPSFTVANRTKIG